MVVRRGYPRLVIDVGKNLEAELGVFVKDLQPARYVIAAVFLDEVLVREQTFEILADLFAPGMAGVTRQSVTSIGNKLVEVIGHGVLPGSQRDGKSCNGTVLCKFCASRSRTPEGPPSNEGGHHLEPMDAFGL